MHSLRPTGRGASSRKYDILTALSAFALRGSKHEQRRVLRFMLLITARYNWRRDRLSVGQREIAMMWSCDERTVKREMARLKALGWLKVIKQAFFGFDIVCEPLTSCSGKPIHCLGAGFLRPFPGFDQSGIAKHTQMATEVTVGQRAELLEVIKQQSFGVRGQ